MSTQPAAQTVTTNADNPTAAATEAVNKLTEHTATADTYLFDDVQATLDWARQQGPEYFKQFTNSLNNVARDNPYLENWLPTVTIGFDGASEEQLTHDGNNNTAISYNPQGEPIAYESNGKRIVKHDDGMWWVHEPDGAFTLAGTPMLQEDGSVFYPGAGDDANVAYKLGAGRVLSATPEALDQEAEQRNGVGRSITTLFDAPEHPVSYETGGQRIELHADGTWWVQNPLGGFEQAGVPRQENGLIVYSGAGTDSQHTYVLGYRFE
ncbi:MAG: hypothetical protein U0105_09890 [Candidatus Obscuribacterales bacterium]|jgi:hypothetical protein